MGRIEPITLDCKLFVAKPLEKQEGFEPNPLTKSKPKVNMKSPL